VTDPRPLLDETTDELERALLREARDVTASPELRRRTLAALGLGAPVAVAKSPALSSGALKILGVALVVGVGIAAYLASRSAPPHAPAPVVAASTRLADPPPPVPPPSVAEAPSALSPPPSAAPLASVRPHASAPAPKPSAGSSMAMETTLIDRARQALYAGQKEAALRALDEYDSRFPAGVFGPEAKKLRARAMALP